MILDSSAAIAVMTRESVTEQLVSVMVSARVLGIGAPTLAETSIVLSSRRGKDAQGLVARFVDEFEIQTILFGARHWKLASEAYARYGKGRHAAQLNFGDCMAYAVARLAGQPLLFVGNDFAKTDIERAM